MPVFIKNGRRVLYAHVPKTGGTAIEMLFERNGFAASFLDRRNTPDASVTYMRCSPQHMHAAMLQSLFNPGSFHFTFMTVRHPVARLISEYRMHASVNARIGTFDDWLERTLAVWPNAPFMMDNHIRPQVEFELPGCRVFKLEDGLDARLVATLADSTGCHFENRSLPQPPRDRQAATVSPSARSVRLIHEIYRRDFEVFGYDTVPAMA